MKSKFVLIALITLGGSLLFSSCTYDDPVVVTAQPSVAISYDFWTGARHVEIDGSVLNNGNVEVQTVNIEFILVDEFGYAISSSWHRYRVNILPGQAFFFSIDIGEFAVYDVRLGRVEAVGFY